MATVRGCDIPDELFYNVDSNVWASLDESGNLTIGMTSYACSLSGQIVSYTPRKVGKLVKKNKSCATVESGKWVGPVKAPVDGEVVEVNPLLETQPELINADPYGQGWIIRLRPSHWSEDVTDLISGDVALAQFDKKMEVDGFGGC
ncbi:MAG: glycine cleavage system protein GcvH [Gammaproteobacteria bacterium]|nr:glycine cleavage system protein GcvH [Gammaproteobacteria bacterium]